MTIVKVEMDTICDIRNSIHSTIEKMRTYTIEDPKAIKHFQLNLVSLEYAKARLEEIMDSLYEDDDA